MTYTGNFFALSSYDFIEFFLPERIACVFLIIINIYLVKMQVIFKNIPFFQINRSAKNCHGCFLYAVPY